MCFQNTQQLQQSHDVIQQQQLQSSSLTGAIPRTPARLPEDVTALADRDALNKDRDVNKNPVTKTYHTLKELLSGKFKKDTNEIIDELNNVVVQPQLQNATEQEDYRSPYSALPVHMRQMQALNQSQPNIWNDPQARTQVQNGAGARTYAPPEPPRGQQHQQQRAISQPQLNIPSFERRGSQTLLDPPDRRGSMANIDVTDSDEGGFASRVVRRPQTMYQVPVSQQHQQQIIAQRQSPQVFQNGGGQSQYTSTPYQHSHLSPNQYNASLLLQQQTQQDIHSHNQSAPNGMYNVQTHLEPQDMSTNQLIQSRQDALRASFQKQMQDIQQTQQTQINNTSGYHQDFHAAQSAKPSPNIRHHNTPNGTSEAPNNKQIPGSAGSSDYDKSGTHSSNVDSGRGSAAYSSGRKAQLDAERGDSLLRGTKSDDSEWVDIVDAELRHILEPGMQGLNIRPESTVSGSVSSMSPPLPPLSPDGSSYKPTKVS